MPRTTSVREVHNYDCPRAGRPVVVSYLFEHASIGHGPPSGFHCARSQRCGVEHVSEDGSHEFNWRLCPLHFDLVREGFLSR